MRWIKWIDTMVAVAIVALVVIARMPGGAYATPAASGNCGTVTCGSGFTGSYHDFVNDGLVAFAPTEAQVLLKNGTQITPGQCGMCHTPHMAIMTALLWNHHLSNNTQFTWDANATTMAGTPYATIANNWAGPSAKCLSCHDGSVAPSTINWYMDQTPQVNDPGPGCTNLGTITTGPQAGLTNYSCPAAAGGYQPIVGNGGSMMHTHPVAMPYPCNGQGGTYNGVTTGGSIVGTEWVASPNLPIRLYQETNGVVTRVGQYTTAGTGCTTGVTGMECTSCHDVHNKENLDTDLVRGYITGSTQYICQECHQK